MPCSTGHRRRVVFLAIVVSLLCGVLNGAAFAQSTPPSDPPPTSEYAFSDRSRAGWKGAIVDSTRLLLIQHTTRIIFHPRTRRELGGPFLRDYFQSVSRPRTWSDGDDRLVNYVGHPIQGAAAGYIWIAHDPRAPALSAGFTRDYWASRGRATAWSAIYSVQFELGILSEASIGNIGLNPRDTGWSDYVMTPLGGLAFMVAEDLAERHVLPWLESRVDSHILHKIFRMAITPSRAFANMGQGHMPWFRPASAAR
jgi:hypothetical protein